MSRKIIATVGVILLGIFTLSGDSFKKTVRLPILMYHHIDASGDDNATVSVDTFEAHLKWLNENGFESVTPDMLIAFVNEGNTLPEKPYLLTFDDGYESNLTLALPLLEKYGVNATIAIIGSSVGHLTYKDTDVPIIPHFDEDGARTLLQSGRVTLASHTWDMHMCAELETGLTREFAARLVGEREENFARAFFTDCILMRDYMREVLDCEITVFAYPRGVWDEVGEAVLDEFSIPITLTSEPFVNTLRCGNPRSLRLLGRFNINESTDIKSILSDEQQCEE